MEDFAVDNDLRPGELRAARQFFINDFIKLDGSSV
jgi:hypothetical protein